jgi:hypothetical protein
MVRDRHRPNIVSRSTVYIRIFPTCDDYQSIEGWGYHLLASEAPIPEITPEEFAARLPEAAQRDLMEWGPNQLLTGMTKDILSRRVPISTLLRPDLPAEITDDQPFNEYFLVRRRAPFVVRLLGLQG